MQRLALIVAFGMMAALLRCPAQFNAPSTDPSTATPPLQTFQGTGSSTTPTFPVQNKWEVRWICMRSLTLTVYSADHAVVAAVTVRGPGSLSLPTGGSYYLQIDGETPPPEAEQPSTPQGAPVSGLIGTINDSGQNQTDGQQPSRSPNGPNGYNNRFEFYLWHVSVFGAPSGGAALAGVPAVVPPNGATNAASAPAAPTAKLTEDQARAVVLITGDNAEGTGFLVKTPDGPCVVTNLHVIGNNPNLKITTNTGAPVKMLSAKGASDRDLAMLSIQDAGYSYLELATDVSKTAQPGDDVITPGNSQGGGVILNTNGKVLGIGPDRVEFDNPIYHGNSGGPVFHAGSNKVLGVVTEAMKVDLTDSLDKTSFASRNSAISSSIRYFGLRLDTVPSWVPLDWNRFQSETAFIEQFDHQSRSLDSFLNPPKSGTSDASGDAGLYLQDTKIMSARDSFRQESSDTDESQRLHAFKDLLYELGNIADSDMTDIQKINTFYSFDQPRVKDEIAYRNALKDELDKVGDDVSHLNGLVPRTSNNNSDNN